MTILLWLTAIHFIEITAIIIFILYRRNIKLQKFVDLQQTKINEIDFIITQGMNRINELDSTNTFRSDDELGEFWKELTQIYKILQ